MRLRTRVLGSCMAVAALAASGPLTAHAYDVDGYVAVIPFTFSQTVSVLGIVTVTVTVNSPASVCTYFSADNADPGGTPEVGVAGVCPASGTGTMTLAGCGNGLWTGTTTLSNSEDSDTFNYSGAIVGGIAVLQGTNGSGGRMVGLGQLIPNGNCATGISGMSFDGFMGAAGG